MGEGEGGEEDGVAFAITPRGLTGSWGDPNPLKTGLLLLNPVLLAV